MSRLHSPYLVELLGYCADHHHRLLIFEFMPNGSLQQHLHPSAKQHQPLNWGMRLRIALDCARALEFLHEHSVPPVIHRDFKCSNVVLDHNFRAKLSDLGSSKTGFDKNIANSQMSTHLLGTTGYVAPELVFYLKLIISDSHHVPNYLIIVPLPCACSKNACYGMSKGNA